MKSQRDGEPDRAAHCGRSTFSHVGRVLLLSLVGGCLSLAAAQQTPPPTPTPQERGLKLGAPTPTPSPDQSKSGAQATESSRPELVLQTGHAMRVDGLAFSPDRQLLASGSADHTVKIWDVVGARELRSLTGHTAWVKAVAFSPDGKWLATGALDGAVKIWDVVSGREMRSLLGNGSVTSLAFSPDARTLAVANIQNMVKLWDAATGQEARTLSGHLGAVLCVLFSPDGKLLASGSADKTIRLWDAATGREARTLTGHTDGVRAIAFSRDGRRLASGSFDATVRVWSVGSGREVRTFAGQTGKIVAVVFSSDQKRIVSSSADKKTIKVWEAESGKEVRTLDDPSSLESVEAAAFSPDGEQIATSTGDKTVLVREVNNEHRERVLTTRSSGVYATAFSRDRKWFASGSKDNTARLWETATGRELFSMEGNIGWITSLAFSPDSRMLASGGLSGAIKLWDVETDHEVRTLAGHTESVNAIAFNKEGMLASASNDKTVKLWDISTGQTLRTLDGHAGEVQSVAFSPDGKLLASGSADKTVKLWDAATGREVRTFSGHMSGVYAVAFSPDGQTLASGSYDKTVKLWDVATGRESRTFEGAAGYSALAFNPEGKSLVAGDLSGAIKMWDVAGARILHENEGHSAAINNVAFSADGRWFTTASEDGSARLWDAQTGELSATMVSLLESNQWLVVAPDGLFDGSPEAWNQILWRFAQNTYQAKPVEVFFNEFYYPGLLAEILSGRRPHAVKDITLRDRRQPQVTLAMADAAANASSLTTHELKVKIEVAEAPRDASHAQGSGAQDLRLFRNGLLVKVWRGDVLEKDGKAVVETSVPVVAGDNELMAYAFNRDNVKSTNAALDVSGDASLKRAGTAYILAIGVNQYANPRFNLRYAVADAQVFGDEVQRAQEKIDSFARIEVVPLTNKEATKANVMLALKRLGGEASLPPDAPPALEKLKTAQPEDTVIIYFAGHGLAEQQRFYLIPHDLGYAGERNQVDAAGLRSLLEHSLSDRELENVLAGIDAAQLVMVLDACNSGQALEAEEKRRGPMNSKGLAQLAYEKGMFILTAAQSYQAAQEAAQLGHGLLTYALVVQGLKEGAADDRPKDGQVVMGEWLDYATARVPQMQLERMRKSRGLLSQIAFVEGEEKIANPENRNLQRPRVFYRRELAERPLVVTKLTPSPAQSKK